MSNGQLWTTTAESEARLDNRWGTPHTPHVGSEVTCGQFARYWDEIDPTQAPTLVAAILTSKTVTNPKADGVTYTGLYAVSDVTVEADNKRHVRIVQKLTRVTQITGGTSAAALAQLPTPQVSPGIKETADFGQLKTGVVESRIIRYVHLNPDATTRERLVGSSTTTSPSSITDAEWGAHISTVLNAALSESRTWTVEYRKWEIEPRGDWTGTLIIGVKAQVWDGSSATGYDIAYTGMKTQKAVSGDEQGHQYEVTTQYPGIPTTSVVAEAQTLRDAAIGDFAVEDISIRYGNEGQSSITVQKTQAGEASPSGTDTSGFLLKSYSKVPNQVTIYLPNITQAVATSLITAWTGASSLTYLGVVYPHIEFDVERHRSGLMTFTLRGSVPSGSGGAGNWVDGQSDDHYKIYMFVSDDGVSTATYLVTEGRKTTSSLTEAIAWANRSTARPAFNGKRGIPKAGTVEYDFNSRLYVATFEYWSINKTALEEVTVPA